MARRKPFAEYHSTTKEERITERKVLVTMQKTKQYKRWLKWAFKVQSNECFYCETKISIDDRTSYHIEHRIPIYYGGKSEYKNLVIACPTCNRIKGTQQLVRDKPWTRRHNEYSIRNGRPPVLYL